MNLFIKKLFSKRKKFKQQITPPVLYDKMVKSLSKNEPLFVELFDDLEDNYCEGYKLINNNFYLGCIYLFKYDQDKQSTYKGKISFIDPSPMVLVTAIDQGLIRGINLNLCSKELKALILNILCNLDEKFFDGQYVDLCNQGTVPISAKVTNWMKDHAEEKIIIELNKYFSNVDYKSLFRTYRISKIKKMKFVEWYILPNLPDIEYRGVPASILKQYWKLSGISQITI